LREQDQVFFRGVKERVFISATEPIMWRRVVFWQNQRWAVSTPFYGAHPQTGNPFRIRNMFPMRPETGGADADVGRSLWPGLVGVDYTEDTRWNTRLDSDNVRVVYDKTTTINPHNQYSAEEQYGDNRRRSLWHPV